MKQMAKKRVADDFDPTDEVPEEKEALRVLQRRWDVLRAIPTAGRSISKKEIADRLYKRHCMGHDIQISPVSFLRYIQRDLEILSRAINALKNEQILSTRKGVSWGESGAPFKLAGLSENEMIAFGMLRKLGTSWMPATISDTLNPYFSLAMDEAKQRVIEKSSISQRQAEIKAKKWLDKIERLPDWVAFEKRPIRKDVEKVIHEALLQEQSLEIVYSGKPRGVVFPQALVQKGVRTYLLVTSPAQPNLRSYLLNRVDSVRISLERFRSVSRAEIKTQLDRGIAQPKFLSQDKQGKPIIYGQPVRLKMLVDAGTAGILNETPMGKDQLITPANYALVERWKKIKCNAPLEVEPLDDWSFVTVTVPLQEELIWWLRSLGPFIKVMEPQIIKDRIEYDLKRALANYA